MIKKQVTRRFAIVIMSVVVVSNAAAWELVPAGKNVPGSREIEDGRVDEAITLLALELETASKEDAAAVLVNLCVAYALKLDYAAALPYCDKAVADPQSSAIARNNRGVVRAASGDYRGAIRDFRKVSRHNGCNSSSDRDDVALETIAQRNLARARQRDAEALTVDSALTPNRD